MKFDKKQIFTIPNILGYFRIILIPIIVYLYMNVTSQSEYYLVIIIIIISEFTDFLDGFIARRFNQVSELGKFIDPLSDKLMQFGLIICLLTRYPKMIYVIILFIIKETFMAINGLINLKLYNVKLDGAKWFGKVCTASLYASFALILLWFDIDESLVNVIVIIDSIIIIITLILYIPVFHQMRVENKKVVK